jgi:hypothetical protein
MGRFIHACRPQEYGIGVIDAARRASYAGCLEFAIASLGRDIKMESLGAQESMVGVPTTRGEASVATPLRPEQKRTPMLVPSWSEMML